MTYKHAQFNGELARQFTTKGNTITKLKLMEELIKQQLEVIKQYQAGVISDQEAQEKIFDIVLAYDMQNKGK